MAHSLDRFFPSLKSRLGPPLRILPKYTDQNTIYSILQDTSGLAPQFSAVELILANKTTEDLLLELGLLNFMGTESDLIEILYNLPSGWDPLLAQEVIKIPRDQLMNYRSNQLSYGELILFYVTGYLPEQYPPKDNSEHVQNYSGPEIVYLADFYTNSIVNGSRIYHTIHSPYKLVASLSDPNLEAQVLRLRSQFNLSSYEALQRPISRSWNKNSLIKEINPHHEITWNLNGTLRSRTRLQDNRVVARYTSEYQEFLTHLDDKEISEIWNYASLTYEKGMIQKGERIGIWTVGKLNEYQNWNLDSISTIDYELQRLLTSATIKELDNGIILVQDSEHLTYGAKTRGLKFFLDTKQRGYQTIVSSGTTHGYGQAAVAFGCQQAGLTCVLFVNTESPRTPMTQMALDLGAIVYEQPTNLRNEELNTLAQNYAQNHPKTLYLPSGLYHKAYIQAFSENIKFIKERYHLGPSRIWIVAGTGIAALAIGLAFPEAELQIVQVGRTVWTDILDEAQLKYHIYIYKETRFLDPASELPPYQSLANFDAKVWYFVKRYGKPGDLIWNIK
jgi:1-aminocyclopropane-1-carboxylate deaminase/D-cysteine desulfhydrase-like pyridoxal-dependent ACC family enzyme